MRFRLRQLLRFSLRTLFIGVTVLCYFLAYEISWIKQRREFLASHDLDQMRTADEQNCRWRYALRYNSYDFHSLGTVRTCPRAPGLLSLFGEEGVNTIQMEIPKHELLWNDETNEYDAPTTIPAVATMRRLFPEATLYVVAVWELE